MGISADITLADGSLLTVPLQQIEGPGRWSWAARRSLEEPEDGVPFVEGAPFGGGVPFATFDELRVAFAGLTDTFLAAWGVCLAELEASALLGTLAALVDPLDVTGATTGPRTWVVVGLEAEPDARGGRGRARVDVLVDPQGDNFSIGPLTFVQLSLPVELEPEPPEDLGAVFNQTEDS